MHDLHSLLTWKCEQSIEQSCASLRAQHQAMIASELSRIFSELERSEKPVRDRASSVREAFNSVPTDVSDRIVEAPEMCFQVMRSRTTGPLPALEFLEDAFEAERIFVEKRQCGSKALWSAMGDRYYPAGSPQEGSDRREGWLEDSSVPYCARKCDGIVIDYFSPYAARPLEQNNYRPDFAPPVPYGASDVEQVTPKVVGAIEGLRKATPCVTRFVSRMARTVMPRYESAWKQFNGGSNRLFIGKINLFNPQLDYIDKSNVVNSLIHECIHIFLYLIEQRVMPADDSDVLHYDLIESPWSERRIHLLSYIHASFVWYGLYHFWSLPESQAEFGGHVRDHYLEFTRKGFRNGAMLDRLERFRKHIRPDLMEQLTSLQGTMLAA